MRYDVVVQGRVRQVQVTRSDGRYSVEIDGRRWSVDAVRIDGQILSLLVNDATASSGGRSEEIILAVQPGGSLAVRVGVIPVDVHPNGRLRQSGGADRVHAGPQRLVAPMPGKVVRVLVKPGDAVLARQPVVVVEAMKMENELRAARDGRVSDVAVRDGQLVEAGTLLAVIADS